jgi:lipid-A-disaccharide synthase
LPIMVADPMHVDPPRSEPLRIAIVAGEASGDALGAAFIAAIRERYPQAEFRGVAGPRMQAAGCQALATSEELAVMGLFEVLRHLPRLWRLRRRLVEQVSAWQPDVFVGIDAPSFNVGLARQLKQRGVRTVQYVSPQLWAWRQGRARDMHRSCDLVLCVLPFEPPFYAGHGVEAEFVGHPLADQIPLESQRTQARLALGIDAQARVVALLPGSRSGEVQRLAPDMLAAARLLAQRDPSLQFLAPMASTAARGAFEGAGAMPSGLRLLDGQARLVLQAADVALVASGTATLEALLCKCPMAVVYRFGPLTAALLRWFRLVKLPYFSLPNLLAGEPLVPEFFQDAVQPTALADALQQSLGAGVHHEALRERFTDIHRSLRVDGARRAAAAVLRRIGIGA